MAKEICISSTPHETRLAILEDDQLAEIYYERENEYTLAGSIYNGRVTRVLPGMQSAFVDIGLERDAFLYVTDFLELEDPEESDEIEKASSSPQAPREVRQSGRGRGERQPREARPQQDDTETTETESGAAEAATGETRAESEDAEGGGKRWRGRRRRRGSRSGSGETREAEETTETQEAAAEEAPVRAAHEIQAEASAPRGERAQPSFVLPGESLQKYGGTAAEDEPKAKAAAPARPAATSRPSTMVVAPLEWDGSGLLPGESLSLHRNRASEPETEIEAEAVETHAHADEPPLVEEVVEEEELTPETEEPEGVHEAADETTETVEVSPAAEAAHEVVIEEMEGDEPEDDASASHHVDPLPPSTFRLFGFGGKKNKGDDEDEPREEEQAIEKPAAISAASAFSPGNGLVEEEVIEGEELDVPLHRHAHRHEEGDLDEYEEETLQTQIRSGALGEMLQEAHLDHRIQLDFDDKNGEGEEEDEGEEEETTAEGQPAGEGQTQQRRERGGRGRRGRGERGGERSGRPGDRRGPSRRSAQTTDLPIISDLLKPGQEILVQIAKEPIAKKGARITSHIALPGRFLVFMPTVTHVGVSRKIASDEERQRLKRILVHERGEASGGFIVRTAAEGASEEELRADLRFLIHLWNEIKQRSDDSKS
ncbi:MAG TPA: ribonuclease E/G, partial [Terracidiphilus sp.]|nr:ribonuclease E/G [Terracidiphilus sp.]